MRKKVVNIIIANFI